MRKLLMLLVTLSIALSAPLAMARDANRDFLWEVRRQWEQPGASYAAAKKTMPQVTYGAPTLLPGAGPMAGLVVPAN